MTIKSDERCGEHGFEDCRICKPGFTPRTDNPYTKGADPEKESDL